jgi:hypothetical protein
VEVIDGCDLNVDVPHLERWQHVVRFFRRHLRKLLAS